MNGTNKSVVIKIVALVLVLVMVFVGGYFIIDLLDGNVDDTIGSGNTTIQVSKRELDGETYVFDHDKTLVLFIGIDGEGVIKEGDAYRCGRQADTIFLIAIDDVKKEVQFLQLDRDTICGVQNYGDYAAGDVVQEQLALSYYYGKGGHSSARNVVESVAGLVDLPTRAVENYFTVAMDGIDPFVSACGGIDITIPQNKDYTWINPTFVGGASVKLTGEEAYKFIHERLGGDDGTNAARMERHALLVPALMDTMANQLSNFSGVTDTKWDSVMQYADSLLTKLELLGLANQIKNYTLKPVLTPTGTYNYPANKEEYASFYVDEDSLNRLIIDLCFKKEGA